MFQDMVEAEMTYSAIWNDQRMLGYEPNLLEDEAYPKNADLLVLPYNGWKDNFPPSVRIIERLNPKRIVLTHYDDTFPPVTMPLDLSPLIRKYKGRVTAMELGKAEAV